MTDTTPSPVPAGKAATRDRAKHLRNKVVDDLIAEGAITSTPVEAAMRTVRREVFTPEAAPEEVYGLYNGFVTKRDENGSPLSSISAPQVQAYMLEQADLAPGMSVLEIGSGGYNAALLAELVGPSGRVVTVDIDPDVTDRASRFLDEAGYSRVTVVLADADGGVPEFAPYDRILVTVGAWDVPPAWIAQLAQDGLLLVPMVIKNLPRVIVFERHGQGLVSRWSRLFGFVPMRGAGAHHTRQVVLREGEITLSLDSDTPVDAAMLEAALGTPRVEIWTGATLGRFEPWADAHLWLASTLPGFCQLLLDRDKDTGLISPPGRMTAASGVIAGTGLAYVTTRRADEDNVEWGVHAYGADAELAESLAGALRVWDRDHRGGPGPRFAVHPAGTPAGRRPGEHVIDKKHNRWTISWSQTASTAARHAALPHPTG